ncbi:hypothetical protein [Parapedobacter defluvii]|uniref:hypothetical protein n=1 Tax=Parapedobacter defluvii TaxID=2045106 RepID=UPI00333EE03E
MTIKKTSVFLMLSICFQSMLASCGQKDPITLPTPAPPPVRETPGNSAADTWTQKEFVLSTFFAVPGSADANQYRRILTHTKNAGINLVELPFISPEALLVALNVAEEVGIQTLAQNTQIYSGISGDGPVLSEQKLADEVKFLQRFSTMEGYYVWDEPFERNFNQVKELNQLLRKYDPGRLAFATLFPSYGVYNWEEGEYNWENNSYAQYVTQYLQQVDPTVLSFNYYPYRDNKESTNLIENDLWKDFGYIRQKGLEYNKPLWYYFQAVSIDPEQAGVMNLERIRAQMYGALAYGVKGLSYYTTHRSLLTETFEKSALYDDLAVLNQAVRHVGNLLFNARSVQLYHTGISEALRAAYFLDDLAASTVVDKAPDNLIIGVLQEPDAGKTFLVVTNKSHGSAVNGTLTLKEHAAVSQYDPYRNQTTAYTSPLAELSLSLAPGEIAIYTIE